MINYKSRKLTQYAMYCPRLIDSLVLV